eukprot:TRINITY_DN15396_c0_g1_i1.p1 TRINITY_DN15396_c0_g1~~TRINITY_DN15396_c0_g1_i1.p1  ORF type:complete len:792 (+),score=241.21 TRINITY_DN15396_c0_g1_i1:90-2465(+)
MGCCGSAPNDKVKQGRQQHTKPEVAPPPSQQPAPSGSQSQAGPGGGSSSTSHYAQTISATLGPVIGSVTETTARVLYEFTWTGGEGERTIEVTIRPQGRDGERTARADARAGLPVVFRFTDLEPGTRYRIRHVKEFHRTDSAKDALGIKHDAREIYTPVRGGFRTWSGDLRKRPLSFAVVSCNKAGVIKTLQSQGRIDLWDDMGQRCQEGDIDCILHLGDQIYADEVDQGIEGGDPTSCFARMLQTLYEPGSKYVKNTDEFKEKCPERKDAVWVLQGTVKPQSEWEAQRATIMEEYRKCYRDTWSHLPTRTALANASNIMICDDHDVSDDWGDRLYHRTGRKEPTPEAFIGAIALQCYHDYQRALREDQRIPAGEYIRHWNDQASFDSEGFTSRWGPVGAIFVDMRGPRSFRCPADELDGDPCLIDPEQWAMIDKALAEWQDVDVLMFCTPVPPVLFSESMTQLGAKFINDCEGQFTYRQKHHLVKLLNMLNDWRKQKPGRLVNVYTGDIHVGQMTSIFDKSTSKENPAITQMIASSVGNHGAGSAGQMVMKVMGGFGKIDKEWDFEHYDHLAAERNYGLVTVHQSAEGKCAVVHSHVTTDVKRALTPGELDLFLRGGRGNGVRTEPGEVTGIGKDLGSVRYTHIAGIGMHVGEAAIFSPGPGPAEEGSQKFRGENVFFQADNQGLPAGFRVGTQPGPGLTRWDVRRVKGQQGNYVAPSEDVESGKCPLEKGMLQGEFFAEMLDPATTVPGPGVAFVRWRKPDGKATTILCAEKYEDSAWVTLYSLRFTQN